jgi:NitT/TauT family transport system permease protein
MTVTRDGTARRRQLFHRPGRREFWLWGGGFMLALLGAWWMTARLGLTSSYFLPAPGRVWASGVEMLRTGQLATDAWYSLQRVTIGFLISSAVALPVGVLMGAVGRIEAALDPVIDVIRYMPAVAFVPLTIVWFGVGEGQKYSIIVIGTFFQQALMVMDDVKRTPGDYVRVGQTLGLSRRRLLIRIVLPAAAPAIWDTLRITLGWAWTWLVVAELVAAQQGLGQRIMVSQRYFETERIFVLIILIGFIGLVSDQLLKSAGGRLFRWTRLESS